MTDVFFGSLLVDPTGLLAQAATVSPHELGLLCREIAAAAQQGDQAFLRLVPFVRRAVRRGQARVLAAHGLRARIFERDGYACVRCHSADPLELDHIVPVCEGGTTTEDNLQTLCRACNRRKGPRCRTVPRG